MQFEIPVTNKDYFIDIDRRDIEYSEKPVLVKMSEISQIKIGYHQYTHDYIWFYYHCF